MKALFCLCDNKGTLCPVHNFDDFIRAETSPAKIQLIMLYRYIREWQALERQYYTIRPWPVIGFIRQMRNIQTRENLTKKFTNEINALHKLNK